MVLGGRLCPEAERPEEAARSVEEAAANASARGVNVAEAAVPMQSTASLGRLWRLGSDSSAEGVVAGVAAAIVGGRSRPPDLILVPDDCGAAVSNA
jgi:hypothetical protein